MIRFVFRPDQPDQPDHIVARPGRAILCSSTRKKAVCDEKADQVRKNNLIRSVGHWDAPNANADQVDQVF
jgi:hypothetical protein